MSEQSSESPERPEEGERVGIIAAPRFLVVSGFVGPRVVDAATGQHEVFNRGDAIGADAFAETPEESAAILTAELHRGRVVGYAAASAASVRAAERASQDDPGLTFRGDGV